MDISKHTTLISISFFIFHSKWQQKVCDINKCSKSLLFCPKYLPSFYLLIHTKFKKAVLNIFEMKNRQRVILHIFSEYLTQCYLGEVDIEVFKYNIELLALFWIRYDKRVQKEYNSFHGLKMSLR